MRSSNKLEVQIVEGINATIYDNTTCKPADPKGETSYIEITSTKGRTSAYRWQLENYAKEGYEHAKIVLKILENNDTEQRIIKIREFLKRGSKIQQLRQIQKDRRKLYASTKKRF